MPIKTLHEKTKDLSLLYVEDDAVLREVNQDLFREFFKSVDCTQDGREGLQMYCDHRHDIVITDVNMPVMGGFEMIAEIRKIREDQPVIVLSAYREIEYLSQLRTLQVSHFMTKPIDIKRFTSVLSEVLSPACENALLA